MLQLLYDNSEETNHAVTIYAHLAAREYSAALLSFSSLYDTMMVCVFLPPFFIVSLYTLFLSMYLYCKILLLNLNRRVVNQIKYVFLSIFYTKAMRN